MKKSSSLVTGAHGFVGRHVARALSARGHFVRGLGHGAWGEDERRSWGVDEWRDDDVTVEALAASGPPPDIVIHCAGSGSVAFSISDPYRDFERTVGTTLSVLEYARLHARDARIVLVSSAGVYGNAQKLPIAVRDPLDPISPYGVHKRIAEDICRSYGRQYGISCAIVRLFSVFGPGLRKQLLWDACSKMSRGEMAFAGKGDETRDWLHIEDAASLLITAADYASPACSVANGATGKGVAIRNVLEALAERLGAPQLPVFSGIVRKGDPAHYVADVADALNWGWSPQRRWPDEICAYVDWFKKEVA